MSEQTPQPWQAPFGLTLPEESRDASTYCFVLPSERTLSPTLVVKQDELEEDSSPLLYLTAQLVQLQAELPEFSLEEEPQELESGDARLVCSWGQEPTRFRQILRATAAGEGAVLLVTATAQPDVTEKALEALEAAAASVQALPTAHEEESA